MTDTPPKAPNTIPNDHRAAAPKTIVCAVITISDTRTLDNDRGGQQLMDHLVFAGHEIAHREIVKDEPTSIRQIILQLTSSSVTVDAILMTGGTGIGSRDQTFETISDLIEKELPGYGELFRQLSYQEIGPAAMLSRAVGGLRGSTLLLTMPGSPAAVNLAMEQLILPELRHLVQQAHS
ncbi:MAG: molybdenum cofactor biosynthesis protein MoaB [Pirellulaceae bacterium]|nr:molybdenum cofactor biosynthesis protein MoaB [Pirellulaceae bacterium]